MTGVALALNTPVTYPARAFRNTMSALMMWDGNAVGGRQGIRPMGGSAANVVTLSGSTITINLHAGLVTPSGWASITGTYLVALTVAETKTLNPAHATNPRKDIVIGQVWDDDESTSGFRKYESVYVPGTAAPSPSEPSVPAGGIKLATIDVPASGGGSPVVTINHTFTAAAGGILPVRSQTERDAISNPHNGQYVHRLDKGWVEYHDGTAWRSHRHIVTPGVLADITNPATGQVVWHTSSKKFYEWSGSAWVPEKIDHVQIATATVSTASTTYVALSGDPAIAFTAPASGAVEVTIRAALNAAHDQMISRASFEMWTGGTPGSGTGVVSAASQNSIATRGSSPSGGIAFDVEFGSDGTLVTGLTAGSTYSVRMVYLVEGSGTGFFARRRIRVRDAAS